ncbi:MAG TPA: 3-hydroxyacyl-CoA dehydrogenase NAD-binding domain-containing protein [Pseudogracilibacillus sp.]|nr:3-hydroxyacyl-CoA dehydrogenase NAD-binding domain-containing protein [Pseudogracilibacillus sp.]
MENTIKNITVIGTGVIGKGWITRFLSHGYHVVAHDIAEGAEEKLRKDLEAAWPGFIEKGIAQEGDLDRLTFETTLEEAVKDADFIQENAPEREDIKRSILKDVDALTKKTAIISSSTSGYMPSTLQADCANPERVIVSHPFNPVYLIPLVEVVGGEKTEQAFVEQARDLFESVDMKPLIVRKEIDGHIGDRLMEAIWREALHIVNDGVATTGEIDASIVYGPGLRWALMGPFLTLHLAGGEDGMRHMLHQFGPALKLPWTKLEAPELTDKLATDVIEGCEAQTEGQDVAKLEERRDDFLVELTELLEKYWPAANLNGRL